MQNYLADQILIYLRQQGEWVNGGRMERLEFRNPKTNRLYKPSTIGRALRDLTDPTSTRNLGKAMRVEKRTEGDADSVTYRYIPNQYEKFHSARQNQLSI